MILAPHILVGAAVVASSPNLGAGLFLAFLSHFILDSIPHWEYSIEPLKNIKVKGLNYCMPILRRVFLDMSLGGTILTIAIVLSKNDVDFIALLVGGFFGILPDGLSAFYFLRPKNKILKTVFDIHQKIHFSKNKGAPPLRVGLTWQIVASALAIYFLIF